MQKRMTDQKKKEKKNNGFLNGDSFAIGFISVVVFFYQFLIFNKQYLIKNSYDTLDRKK